MRSLPLYPELPRVPVETTVGLSVDRGCTRCALHKGVKTVCMSAEGEPGGILIVGDFPGKNEDASERPFTGAAGHLLRTNLAKHWQGPVAFDNALRCAPGKTKFDATNVEACRPYLAQTYAEVRPSRIIVLGPAAALSVLGRAVYPFDTRKGYGWVVGVGDRPIPAFFLTDPKNACRNRFQRQWFEEDLQWAINAEPPLPPWKGVARIIETPEDARVAVAALREALWVTFDTETAGRPANSYFEILTVGLVGAGEDDAWVWPRRALGKKELLEPLLALLCDPQVPKVAHNAKYDDLSVMAAWGQRMLGLDLCTKIGRKLTQADASGYLEDCAELVGMGGHKVEAQEALEDAIRAVQSARKRSKKAGGMLPGTEDPALEDAVRRPDTTPKAYAYALIPTDKLHRYVALDTMSTDRLAALERRMFKAEPAYGRTWDRIARGASSAYAQVEGWGIWVDKGALRLFEGWCDHKVREAEAKIQQLAPEILNPGSPQQVSAFIYGKLKIKPKVFSEKTGVASTNDEALQAIKDRHPVIPAILDYREYVKLRGNYASGLWEHIRDDGRVHPNFNLDGARSGRTSCDDPNLQNIPRVDDKRPETRLPKNVFAAPPGYKLVQLDYKTLELRIAAMLSGDPLMKAVFASGLDYHLRTAQLVAKIMWGIDPSQVTKEHRNIAKIFNFGLLYGMTDGGLARRIGCSKAEAAKLRAAILGQFKVLAKWIREKLLETRKTGDAWTYWEGQTARRRPLWPIASPDEGQRINAENSAGNTPIQGTASDYCVRSASELVEWIIDELVPAKVVATVHDSILFEVRDDAIAEVVERATEVMTSWFSDGVPLEVDVEVGQSWGALEKYMEAA